MMALLLTHPLRGMGVTTQTFDEHVAWAKANGYCHLPGPCSGNGHYYGGWDLGAPTGTPVVAAYGGKVVKAGFDSTGYGNYVKVSINNVDIIYAHLSTISVKVGEIVQAGQVIGLSGSTGNSTGPHLHFEYREGGIPKDPQPMVMGGSGETQPVGEPEFYGRIPAVGAVGGQARYAVRLRDGAGVNARTNNAYIPAGGRVRFVEFQVVNKVELWGCVGGYPEQWAAVYYGGDWLIELDEPGDGS